MCIRFNETDVKVHSFLISNYCARSSVDPFNQRLSAFNKDNKKIISYLLLRWFLLVLELLLWLFLLHSWQPAMIWSLLLLEMNSLADKLPAEFLETAEFSAPF